ncbi:MAG: hypothetical protein IPJ88_07200 [Myxococcales bacterium]|nr:MAG: hypothetical protein IPJ88_07200 [Myxococcales bacterium]
MPKPNKLYCDMLIRRMRVQNFSGLFSALRSLIQAIPEPKDIEKIEQRIQVGQSQEKQTVTTKVATEQ